MDIESEQINMRKVRMQNIFDMGLGFTSMIRVFKKGSKLVLWKRLVHGEGTAIVKVKSKEEFDDLHAKFCDWGTKNITQAERRRDGRIIKPEAPASYGQIAKTLDVVLKVAVYYSHLPDCETAGRISKWLDAAVDTQMMAKLAEYYPDAIGSPWPTSVEEVDSAAKYLAIQKVVHRFIEERHNGSITPVQFDDKYWDEWNP